MSIARGRLSFVRLYLRAYLPEVREQMTDMAMNGSGIRDTARVLNISKGTVISTLKKSIHIAEC